MATVKRFDKSHLAATTNLSPGRTLEISTEIADQIRGLRVDQRTDFAAAITLRNELRVEILTFTVTAEEQGSGTAVGASLDWFRTEQPTLYFIPIGPKTITGYGKYRAFMRALESALLAADHEATVSVIEEAGPQ